MANIAAVAGASLGDDADLHLPQGQRIVVRELPVRRAAIYVPGGRNPYPSTVLMGAVTARVAGVEEIVVVSPRAHPVVLAACALCGVDEVYRFGGAHGIAALAYGTETIARADVIAGPAGCTCRRPSGSSPATSGSTASSGRATSSSLASEGSDPFLAVADLLAQAEHGAGTIVALASHRRGAARRRGGAAGGRERGGRRRSSTSTRSRRASPSPRRSRPSTSSSWGATRRRWRRG